MSLGKLLRPATLLGLLTVFALPGLAQSTTAGDVVGVVSDPSKAVIAKATVTAKNDSMGVSQTTSTNNQGFFRFSFLKPGTYTISANASGFEESSREVQVGLGQVTTANFLLEVSKATTVIEVTAPALQVENADLSTNFGTQQIANVPNPGNDLSSIAQTAPGVTMNTQGGFGNFSSYGLPATSNLFTIDGQNDNDPFLNLNNSGATNLLLGANEIQEATVTNNGYSGQYGQLAGAQVNYVTKSGGNKFHGNAVYYWNGRTMNANSFFNNAAGVPRAFDNINQWAASFGGPIKKDKTFFFWDYEGLRIVLPTSAAAFIPSPQFQAATLANLAATGKSASVPFYQNMFNLYNTAKGASGAVPTPTDCSGFTPLAAGTPCTLTFRSTAGNFTHEYLTALRIDHKFSENDNIFGRVQTDHGLQATITDPINPLFNTQSTQPEYQGQLGWTHLMGANAVNEFKASGQWYSAIFDYADRAATQAAFPTVLTFADASLSNMGGSSTFPFPQGRNVTQYQFVNDFSLNRGPHTWKLGVNYRRNDVTTHDVSETTAGVLTTASLANFFNGGGIGDSLLQNFPTRLTQPLAFYGIGFYGQDEWRATKKLRLTLALRLDHNSNPVCQTNCFARLAAPFTLLDHTNAENVPYNQTILTGQHQAYPATDKVVWQPRVGFTYSPSGKTVVRGGFGIFVDSFPALLADTLLFNSPTLNSFVIANKSSIAPLSPTQPGNVFALASAANSSFTSAFAGGGTFNSISAANPFFSAPTFVSTDAKVRQPRYQEWSLSVQRELGRNTVASVGYVGNHGIFEAVQNGGVNAFSFNAPGFVSMGALPQGRMLPSGAVVGPDARFGTVTQVQSIAVSNYNGLVTSVRHNFSKGFAFQLNYTYSHALDEVSNGGLSFFNGNTNVLNPLFPINPFNLRANYGNADYDVRHYFSANYVWDDIVRHFFHGGPNAILGGWTVSGTIFSRTGLPFSVIDNGTSSALRGQNYGAPSNSLTASELLAEVVGPTGSSRNCGGSNITPATACLNAAGFASPTSVMVNQARNSFFGPKYFNTDFTVMKYTKLAERANLGIGFQFFNLFNHPNFDQPVGDIANPNFGVVQRTLSTPTSILGSFLGGDASPRLIQLKAEFKF